MGGHPKKPYFADKKVERGGEGICFGRDGEFGNRKKLTITPDYLKGSRKRESVPRCIKAGQRSGAGKIYVAFGTEGAGETELKNIKKKGSGGWLSFHVKRGPKKRASNLGGQASR